MNNIKPDYSNAGGLELFDGDEWVSWYLDEYEEPEEYLKDFGVKITYEVENEPD